MQVDLGAADSVTETKFSPNVISLEMKGPCFPNTSFVDLPGIFAISDNREDDYLVEIIENLTRKYVRREEAIIMLALPMDQDVDNSRALKIIRELHAESRTIGVLTKADKPNFNSADTIAYWLAVLGEKKQKVKRHGFYVTALPPDKDGDSLEAWERDFFVDDVGSWPHAFDDYVHRCGVDQLRFHITTELEVAVAKSIPKIKEKILNRLAETQRHLDEMPDLPQNVEHEVRTNLKDLYVSVKHAFDCQDFEKEYKGLTEWFYRHLLELKPKCSVISRAANARPEGIVIIDSDDGNDHPPSQKRSAPRTPALGSTPKRQRRVEFVPNQEDDFTRLGNFSSPATQAAAAAQRSGAKKFKLSLQELQSEIRHRTRGGFSDIVPLELHEDLCLRAVSQWEKPLQKFMSEVTKMLSAKLTGALESSLKLLSKRRIYNDAKELFDEFLQEGSAHQLAKLKELYGSELYRVVTINEDALNHFKAKEKQDIERARLYTRAHEAGLHGDDRSCKPYGDMSHEEKLEEARLHAKWQAQLPKDHFQREIEVAAKVRAYYLTAATRFVDNVSMDVNASLFRSFREQALNEYMDTKLGLSSNPAAATYERLMGEDHATALRRRELKKERSKLMTAMNRIIDLDNSFTHMA
ncbi:P-loop containing nucleoside triphosphate hydrolase protein [Xylaria sp. CBS 124048]|nr:P-loop containing nucleoside triphosphate hydrolase protein [Xylaria sp. CBS 124048]